MKRIGGRLDSGANSVGLVVTVSTSVMFSAEQDVDKRLCGTIFSVLLLSVD